MNIQPVQNNISMEGRFGDSWNSLKNRVMQKAVDAVPKHTVKESASKIEAWEKIVSVTSRPAENRGIMGATALLTQPVIDMNNKQVDEETRKVSRNRTIAKIVAGTSVGMFVVRGPIYKAICKMTNVNGNSKFSKALLPKSFIKEIAENQTFMKNYRSSLAMAIALPTMLVTNFVLDAPLTIILTNWLNKKTKEDINEK